MDLLEVLLPHSQEAAELQLQRILNIVCKFRNRILLGAKNKLAMFSWRQDPTVVLLATLSCSLVLQSLPLPQVLEPSFLWYTCSQFMLLKLFALVLDFKFIYISLQNGLLFTSCKHKYLISSPGWSPCCPHTPEHSQPYLWADFQSSVECQQMCTSLHWNLKCLWIKCAAWGSPTFQSYQPPYSHWHSCSWTAGCSSLQVSSSPCRVGRSTYSRHRLQAQPGTYSDIIEGRS